MRQEDELLTARQYFKAVAFHFWIPVFGLAVQNQRVRAGVSVQFLVDRKQSNQTATLATSTM